MKVGLRERLYVAPPRRLRAAGALCLAAAASSLLFAIALPYLGYEIPPLASLATPFAFMALALAGMWLFMLASASSSFERRVSKYVSKEEVARIEEEVERELSSVEAKARELAKRVMVKRRVEELYRKRAEEEFLEALKRRLRFKAGESILSMASGQWSGSAVFLAILPMVLIASLVLATWLGWLLMAVLLLMAFYFSSLTQSVLYVATNRRLIKRTVASSLFRRSERSEELRWSAVKQVKVSRGRRGLKIRLRGEGEIIDVEGLGRDRAEQLLKVIEAQVSAARAGRGAG